MGVKHPWTNGQVERMNRTIKEATVKRYHYDSHDQLRQHLGDSAAAYHFGYRLKTLKGLTPTKPSARHGKTNQNALRQPTSKCWTKQLACFGEMRQHNRQRYKNP